MASHLLCLPAQYQTGSFYSGSILVWSQFYYMTGPARCRWSVNDAMERRQNKEKDMKVYLFSLMMLAGFAVTSKANAQVPPDQLITCQSQDKRPASCAFQNQGDVVVQIANKLSSSSCDGKWNYDQRNIYVTKGCRAIFRVMARSFSLKCESWNNQPSTCNPGVPIAAVSLIQEESHRSCSSGWSFNSTEIYVQNGCRGTFLVTRQF